MQAGHHVRVSIVVHKGSPLDYPHLRHTALWLQFTDGSPSLIMNIIGTHGLFEFERHESSSPTDAADFARLIHVGSLATCFTPAGIELVLREVEIDNADREFNCQTWVQRALERLKDSGELSDAAYAAGIDEMIDVIAEAEDQED